MKEYNWEDYTDEDIKDDISLAYQVMDLITENQELSEFSKRIAIDDCLDNLNTLYDEQRKRGTFKRNFGTA